MELIKQAMATLSKYLKENNQQLSQILNKILKSSIISTMLHMIDNYAFSSMTNQLAIQILDQLKESFDESDVETLKNFVQANLGSSEKTKFVFESGRQSSALGLGQFV